MARNVKPEFATTEGVRDCAMPPCLNHVQAADLVAIRRSLGQFEGMLRKFEIESGCAKGFEANIGICQDR